MLFAQYKSTFQPTSIWRSDFYLGGKKMGQESLRQVKARQQQKADTYANWQKAGENGFIPLRGEIIVYLKDEENPQRIKVGDGVTLIEDLEFISGSGGVSEQIWKKGEGKQSAILGSNSTALGDYSVAAGNNTTAGIKGFNVAWINADGKGQTNTDYNVTIILTTQNVPPILQRKSTETPDYYAEQFDAADNIDLRQYYKIGDTFSIQAPGYGHWTLCGKIAEISRNIIYTNDYISDEGSMITDGSPQVPFHFSVPFKEEMVGEITIGDYSFAEGYKVKAASAIAHAEGYNTLAFGMYSHAEGNSTRASYSAHAEGKDTNADGFYSHAEGFSTFATGMYSHAEGNGSRAIGTHSHAEGNYVTAYKSAAHAEGYNTYALGTRSHAEGGGNNWLSNDELSTIDATNAYSLWKNKKGQEVSIAIGESSHIEGTNTLATAKAAHAEGNKSAATGSWSHAEGNKTLASGEGSHTEGQDTVASAKRSHAEGTGTIAASNNQHVQGAYNIEDASGKYVHIVGWGSSASARKNIHTVAQNGDAWFAGNITVGANNEALAKKSEVNAMFSYSNGVLTITTM